MTEMTRKKMDMTMENGKFHQKKKGSCRKITINNGNLSMKKIPELEAKLCG